VVHYKHYAVPAPAEFLYVDQLFANQRQCTFCSTKLCWITRRAPFGVAHLSDKDLIIDFSEVTTEHDIVTMNATQPLTHNEAWYTMVSGEYRLFVRARVSGNAIPRQLHIQVNKRW
jgi:glutamine amidotransferase